LFSENVELRKTGNRLRDPGPSGPFFERECFSSKKPALTAIWKVWKMPLRFSSSLSEFHIIRLS
jgi:hypothetical protein